MSTALSTPLAQNAAAAPALPPDLSGRQKAAIIVQVLLADGGKLSLSNLSDGLQTKLIHEMAALRHVDHATLQTVVQEFIDEFDAAGLNFPGALEGARRLKSYPIQFGRIVVMIGKAKRIMIVMTSSRTNHSAPRKIWGRGVSRSIPAMT